MWMKKFFIALGFSLSLSFLCTFTLSLSFFVFCCFLLPSHIHVTQFLLILLSLSLPLSLSDSLSLSLSLSLLVSLSLSRSYFSISLTSSCLPFTTHLHLIQIYIFTHITLLEKINNTITPIWCPTTTFRVTCGFFVKGASHRSKALDGGGGGGGILSGWGNLVFHPTINCTYCLSLICTGIWMGVWVGFK